MSSVTTVTGRLAMLRNTFYNQNTVSPYRFVCLGIGTPNEVEENLGSECNPVTHTGYERVEFNSVTFESNTARCTIEGLFETTNISNTTGITEVALSDSDILDQGTMFCLCSLSAPINKNNSAKLRLVINVAVV